MKDDSSSEAFEGPDPILEKLRPSKIENGVLIPLKTTLELRDDHHCSRVLITRAPVKMVAAVLNEIRILVPEEVVKGMPHLRRCCKCSDLPAHLKTQFMNDTPHSRQIHTGKSSWVYIMIGLEAAVPRRELIGALSKVEGMEECGVFTATIPVPLFPPTSQVQAALWSGHFWPTVYRKNNPLGPHPSMVTRATEEITDDAPFWMALAHQVAAKTNAAGYGEAMGACIIQRSSNGSTRLVALAGDARWHKQSKAGCTGNPMAHCVLRAISMVAQKLVRAENRDGEETVPPILEFEAFQDAPLVDDEQLVFGQEHPSPDGYLCHGLELYMTHEPCVMCSMAILHSRMGRATFSKRMPLTGGLSAEDRALGYPHHPHLSDIGGGHGLGLFWRRELNWSLLAWEWEPTDACNPLLVGPEVHV